VTVSDPAADDPAPVPVLHQADHGAVRLLRFDRPDARNAFDFALYTATADALDDARADDTVHAVVLTGSGRAFSAGQDLDEMALLAQGVRGGADADGPPLSSGFPRLLEALQAFDKPLLAAVNGAAVGIGCTMLPHCDLVLVSEDARLRVPFAPLGVPPEAASSYLLPMRMGWQRAAEVLFTGDWISAEQAVADGLALRVVPADELLDATLALAARVAEAPLPALRAIKAAMADAQRAAVADARAREEASFADLLGNFRRP
jgi:enoyl-CoA hydratase/carnithine racemase